MMNLSSFDRELVFDFDRFCVPASAKETQRLLAKREGSIDKLLRTHDPARGDRSQQLVCEEYEAAYDLSVEQFVEKQDHRRDLFRVSDRYVHVNGWYIVKTYTEIYLKLFSRLEASSFLEIGSGRGVNLTIFALRRPDVRLAGIELTEKGVTFSKRLLASVPPRVLEVAGCPSLADEQRTALTRVQALKGNGRQIPFAAKSFDCSYTCLVLEQIPRHFPEVLEEMRWVTRRYCAFIEPFSEANQERGKAYLAARGYFRASYGCFKDYGLEPIYFTTAFPQKLHFGVGLLVTRVMG